MLSAGYYDAYYLKALQVRTLIRRDFAQAFEHCDVIAAPTAPTTAFRLGEKVSDPLAMYLSDIFTTSVNLAGLPGLSVPCGFDAAGLPIGLQLIAPAFGEETRCGSATPISAAPTGIGAGRRRRGRGRPSGSREGRMSTVSTQDPTIDEDYGDWEPVIGLEVHAQLLTAVEALLRLLGAVRRRGRTRTPARSAWACRASCRC